MKNASWKRMLCLLMSVAMLISCCPVTALAVNEEEEETELPTTEEAEIPVVEAVEEGAEEGAEEVPAEPAAEVEEAAEEGEEEVISEEAEPIVEADDEEKSIEEIPEGEPTAPVRVSFICTPEELTLTVTDADGSLMEPEEDGSYLLLPGEYRYTAVCEGYLSAENVPFTAEGEAEIEVTLCAEEEPAEVGEAALGTILSVPALTSGGSGTVVASGTCGDDLTWTLDDAGVLTISGTGAMTNYNEDVSAPWYEHRADITEAVIGSGVTSIGNYAFFDCYNMAGITIPNTVTSIGSFVFFYCSALGNVTLPGTVTSIGADAFYACRALTHINIPNDVTAIGEAVFASCSALQSITIPAGVTAIDATAFGNCPALTSVTVAPGNSVYHSAGNCVIETASNTLVFGCATSVIPSDGSVTSIGDYAFYGSGLTAITIPLSVTSIGTKAFSACYSLTDVYYPGSPQQWDAVSVGESNGPLSYSIPDFGLAGSGKCGENVTWVLDNDGLLTVSGTGDMEDFEYYGPWCEGSGVKKAVIEEGVTSVGDYAFKFQYCLASVTLPSTLTRIGDSAFNGCSSLKTVNIPKGVKSIGEYAFCGCDGFTKITLPSSLETIGENAFSMCDGLTSLVIPKSVTHIGDYCFSQCPKLSSVSVEKGSTAFRVSGSCLIDVANAAVIFGWGQCVIPSDGSVTAIADGAFSDNKTLTTISVPGCVTRIGAYAFQDCTALTDAALCDGVTSIGTYAFGYCEALKSLTIPSTVEFIEPGAFFRALALTDVYYAGTPEQWNELLDKTGDESYNGPLFSAEVHCAYADGGKCGADLTWKLDNSGVLTISGSGDMWDFDDVSPAPWYNCREDVTRVILADGVTGIGEDAFYGCGALTGVTIPDTVTRIGTYAFFGCEALSGVAIPAAVTSIGENAFSRCPGLTAMTVASGNTVYHSSGNCIIETASKMLVFGCGASVIPDDGSVTSIGGSAFNYCSSLTNITIPEGVTTIGAWAFSGCSALASVSIPYSVTSIENGAFSGCYILFDLYYAGSPQQWDAVLTWSGNGALDSANHHYGLAGTGKCGEDLTWVLTNDGLLTVSGTGDMTEFEYYAPWGDLIVRKAVIEEGVTSIGRNAFGFQYLMTDVTLPSTLTRIGDSAFNGCFALKAVDIPDGVTSIGEYAFCDCDCLTAIVLPSALETIGESAFCSCSELSSLVIPKSVTHIGDYCFISCPKLSSLTVEKGSTAFRISGSCLIDVANKAVIYGWGQCVIPDDGSVTAIADGAFDNNTVLTSIVIPEGVTRIGNYAFRGCEALTDVTASDGLESIGTFAFEYCDALKSITIPSTVEFIEYGAFYQCMSLADVYYFGTQDQWDRLLVHISTGENDPLHRAAIHCAYVEAGTCGENLTWTLTPEGVLTIKGSGAMENWDSGNTSPWAYSYVTEIVIGDGVTSIGSLAFPFKTNLLRVTIPGSVTDLGVQAFFGCTKLTEIELPEGVKSIGSRAFEDCEALTEITLPSTLESIGDYAFSGCRALVEIAIPEGVQHVGTSVFALCSALRAIRVAPENTAYRSVSGCLIDISEKALIAGCGNAVIPDDGSVTSIADNAFFGNKALTAVTIPEGVKSIGACAFDGCINLSSVTISEGVKTIGNIAFCGCRNLTDVTLPNTLTKVDEYAFQSCGKLTSVVLPASLRTIGEGAFTSYTAPESVAYLGTEAQWALVTGVGKSELDALGVTFLPPAASVTVTLSDGSAVPGRVDLSLTSELSLTAKLTPAGCRSSVAWTSSDESVAAVEENGTVRFLSVGDVTVTATAQDGGAVSGSVTISVYFAEDAAALTASTDVPTDGIPVGSSASMTVCGADKSLPLDASLLCFVSDNPAVAAVDENGVITAVAPGNAAITASFAGNDPLGRSVCVFVTVTPALTASGWKFTDGTELDISDSTLALNVDASAARTFRLALTDGAGNELPAADYTFTSSSTKVAKIVKAKDGNLTLTVPKNASGACTVTAKPTDKTLSGAALTLSVFVRNYAPRLSASKVTLNSYDTRGVTLGVVPSYGNEIEGVKIEEKVGKTEWALSAELAVRYDEESGTLTVCTADGSAVANRTVTARLVIDGSIAACEVPFTVAIKNTLPALTVKQTKKLNRFLTDDFGTLTLSAKNAEIVSAELEIEGYDAAYANGALTLRSNGAAPATKGTLLVYFAGYSIPLSKTVSFSAVNAKPSLAATPASGAVNGRTGGEVSFTVYNKTEKRDVALGGCTVTADKGFVRISGNRVCLSADSAMLSVTKKTANKVTLTIDNPAWTAPLKVTYTLTVQPPKAAPAAKLKTSALTLNNLYPSVTASTLLTLDQTGRCVEGTFTCPKTDKIAVTLVGDQVVAKLLEPGVPVGSYVFVGRLSADGDAMKDVKLTVKVVNTAAAATVSASGKLDAIRRSSAAVTYAVTLKNTASEITSVTTKYPAAQLSATVVNGANKFSVALGEPDSKGRPTVIVKLKPNESYDTKLTYKLRFVLDVDGVGSVTTADVSIKVPQSALKLVSVPAQTVYQSQPDTRTLAYTLTVNTPADAKIAKIEKGSGMNALFCRTLADSQSTVSWEIAPDGRSATVYVTVSDTSRLTVGKSYAIPLVITAEGCAVHGSVTKVNLSLKVAK